jgi:hypothetical protein
MKALLKVKESKMEGFGAEMGFVLWEDCISARLREWKEQEPCQSKQFTWQEPPTSAFLC